MGQENPLRIDGREAWVLHTTSNALPLTKPFITVMLEYRICGL